MSNQFVHNLKSEFYKRHTLFVLLFVFFMTATFSFFAARFPQESSAASLAQFNPGNIISDAVMGNYNSMSVQEIQNFLKSKNHCNNRDYSAYLEYTNRWPHITWHWEGEPYNGRFVCMADELFGDGEEIGSGQTAAQIIYDAAQKFRINPQVLLVLLEKESSLITDTYPNSLNYRSATGYGCPDTSACSSKYYGFKNQIYNAAELFRYTLDNSSVSFPEQRPGVYVGYNPTSSCGGSTVWIENRATAALYRYTPYQPNSAALNAGYGVGDGCSAYGNRNFYLYFTDWFGSTQAAVDGEQILILDGEYSISPLSDTDSALNASGSSVDLARLDLSNNAQRWDFQRDSTTGYYQITNVATGRPLSTQSTEPGLGTGVTNSHSYNCSKDWRIYRSRDDQVVIESTCSNGIVLNTQNSSVDTYIFNNTRAQKWVLIAGRTIPDGVYTLSSSNNSQKMIDIEGGWNRNGVNVQLWSENNAGAQKWRIEYDTTHHYYTLTNPSTNKRFDLEGAHTAKGTNIGIWQAVDACSQYWQIVPSGEYYTILSTCAPGRAADLVGGYTTNTTNIRLWETNGANAQRWQLHNQQILPDGDYEIVSSEDRNYAIDIEGGWNYNGVNVNLYEANGSETAQLWHVRYNERTGDYTLLNQSGDRSLDLAGCGTAFNTNIQLWSNNTACAQRWVLVENSDGTYTFISTCSHERALDLVGGYTYNTNNIRLWETNGANAQRWYFNRK